MTGVSNRQPPFTSETTTLKGESRKKKALLAEKTSQHSDVEKNHRNDAGVTASPAYREHKVTFPLIKIYLLRKANLLLINKNSAPSPATSACSIN